MLGGKSACCRGRRDQRGRIREGPAVRGCDKHDHYDDHQDRYVRQCGDGPAVIRNAWRDEQDDLLPLELGWRLSPHGVRSGCGPEHSSDIGEYL
jgi:hypothetical protein